MTRDELSTLLTTMQWFSTLGGAVDTVAHIALRGLEPWGDVANASAGDIEIADEMSWLPSSRDGQDPFGSVLADLRDHPDEAARRFPMAMYKIALVGLRGLEGNPRFRVGVHDFAGAAKGAALFATRASAAEVALGGPGAWCAVLRLYAEGKWPCGLMSDGRLVVF